MNEPLSKIESINRHIRQALGQKVLFQVKYIAKSDDKFRVFDKVEILDEHRGNSDKITVYTFADGANKAGIKTLLKNRIVGMERLPARY